MSTIVDVLAVEDSLLGKPFSHIGLCINRNGARSVLSKRPGGWRIESFEKFGKGRRVEYITLVLTSDESEIKQRINALNWDEDYSALFNNCEHAVFRLLGIGDISPQLQRSVKSAVAGLGIGAGLAWLAGSKSLKTSAAIGALLANMVRPNSLKELYLSCGVPVMARPQLAG